jgi:hypothetical protein
MLGPFTPNPRIRGLASALCLLIYFFNLKGQTTHSLPLFFFLNKNSTNNMLSTSDDERVTKKSRLRVLA